MPPPVPPSDALLKHAGFVRALAFAALSGDSESEDVAQDAWVAALEHAPEEPARQRPWFVRVVQNRAAELLRLRGRRARRERVAVERRPALASTADLAEQAETGRLLVGAVLALEEPFKSAILLRFHEDLPPREVAQRLGVPLETARSRVRRGLERLRMSMAQGARPHGSDWRAALAPLVPVGAFAGSSVGTVGAVAAGGVVVKKFGIAALLLVLVSGGAWLVWDAAGRSEDESESRVLTADAPAAGGVDAKTLDGAPSLEGGNASRSSAAKLPGPLVPATLPRTAIRGIVVDEAGKPVPGAEVRVVSPHSRLLLHLGAVAPTGEPIRFQPVRTDAEGRFAFLQPEYQTSNALNLRASAPGRVQKGPQASVYARMGEEVRLTLLAGVAVDIEVVDAEGGAPVGGATVEVHSNAGYVLYTSEPIDEVVTDSRGHARVTVLPGEASFAARAPGRGFAAARSVGLALPEHRLRLALRAAGTVEGIVLRPDGRPLEGAQVLLLRYPSERRSMTSDAGGRVRFDDVPSEDPLAVESKGQRVLVLAVSPEEGRFGQAFAADPPPPGSTRTVRLQLSPRRTLSGTLRRRDGTPAAGVEWRYGTQWGQVEWGWTSQTWKGWQVTGADGQFRLPDLPPGVVLFQFGKTDSQEPTTTALVPVDADPAPLEVIFEDEPRLVNVLVLDGDARPVREAHLTLLGPNVGAKPPRATTTTDGTAQLALRGLPPWEVAVDPARHAPSFAAVPETLRSDPAKPDVVVRLGSGVLEGRVLHLDGRPAQVQLHLALPSRTGLSPIESSGRIGGRSSGADGRFQFNGVSQIPYGIRCSTMGLRVVEEGAEFRAGQTPIEVHVATAVEALAMTLTVEVVDASDGRGLTTGVLLEARPAAGGGVIPFLSDVSAGMFTAARLAQPGTWTVRASRDGYEPAEATVEVSSTTAVPRLRLALRRR